jgi:LacI family transcriptional regulator
VIDELGYRPSALARSLIRQRSHTLGVVIAGLSYIGPSRILSGIASSAEESGYSLLLKELPRFDENNIEPIFQELQSRHVDGIIWAVPEVGDNRTWIGDSTPDIDVPLVYLTMEPREDVSVVSIDNYAGGRLATSHLLEQGYRNIGHISGPLDWWEARQRKSAWRDALQEAGLEARDEYWVEGNWSSASGAEVIGALLDRYRAMDSIFVANDQMALGAIQQLMQRGVRVPQDIGIVGFDNMAESAYFSPALTTIQQDQHEIAKLAVTQINKIIEASWQQTEQIPPQSIVLPPALVVRQSSVRTTE